MSEKIKALSELDEFVEGAEIKIVPQHQKIIGKSLHGMSYYNESKRVKPKTNYGHIDHSDMDYIENEDLLENQMDTKLNKGAMEMLKAAAMFYPNKISKARIGAIAGFSYKSGTFGTYLGKLKRNGLIEGAGKEYNITEKGIEIAGEIEPLPTDPTELVEKWARIVKGGAGRMLKELAKAYPDEMTKEELGELTEMSSTSGTFGTYIGTLKRNGLIEAKGKILKASPTLFGED